MENKLSFSVTIKPGMTDLELSDLIGKWNPEVKVELTTLSTFTTGPVTIIYPDIITIDSAKPFLNPR